MVSQMGSGRAVARAAAPRCRSSLPGSRSRMLAGLIGEEGMAIQGILRVAPLALLGLTALLLAAAGGAQQPEIERTLSAPGAGVYIISPNNGESLSAPVTVRFGLSGMGVAPAGVPHPATGHHHLVIDAPVPNLTLPLPSDEHHRHFGGGQTEVSLNLSPGEHTLQLVLADHLHVPHDPPVISLPVKITVR